MSTICLVLIVKDEEEVIERCLRSAMPVINSWSIVDTGSTDRTKEIIREVMKDIPGELHECPWVDFAHNRSEMIDLARGKADYDLMMDADDVMVVPEGFKMPRLTADKYDVMVLYGNLNMPRPHIFKNDVGYRFESVLHEYLHKDGVQTHGGTIQGLTYKVIGGGKRSSDPVAKFQRDAEVLKRALSSGKDRHLIPRYTFYLAQSYKDTATCMYERGDKGPEPIKYMEKALKTYLRRVSQGSYYEEVFVSLMEIAKLSESLKRTEREIHDAFVKAYEYLPARGAEPLYHLSRFYRLKDRFALAYVFARAGATIATPAGLFVDREVYAWRMNDEWSLAAYYTDRFQEALDVTERVLASPDLNESDRPRILENLRFCKEKLGLVPESVVTAVGPTGSIGDHETPGIPTVPAQGVAADG